MDRLKLGRMLTEAKLLTQDQLKKAVEFQKEVGGKLGAIIVKLGFVSDETLTNFLARQQGLPIVNLTELVLPWNLVKRVPRALIEKHQVLPIAFKDGVLTLAISDPFDYEAIEEIQLATNYRIEIHLASREQIKKAISDVLHQEPDKTKEEILKDLEEGDRKSSVAPPPLAQVHKALVALLVEKQIITEKELHDKVRQMK